MNTTLQSIKINDGSIRESEVALWVGTSKVADSINGRLTTMSVSKDEDWLWVRFNVYPSEKYAGLLKSAGFTWSKKRKGHHAPISQLSIKTLRNFGADTLDHHRLTGTIPPRHVEMVRMNVDLDADTPPAPKAPRPVAKVEERAEKVASPRASKRDDEMAQLMAALAASQRQVDALIAMMANKVGS